MIRGINVILICLYAPYYYNSNAFMFRYFSKFQGLVSVLTHLYGNVIALIGDINVHPQHQIHRDNKRRLKYNYLQEFLARNNLTRIALDEDTFLLSSSSTEIDGVIHAADLHLSLKVHRYQQNDHKAFAVSFEDKR